MGLRGPKPGSSHPRRRHGPGFKFPHKGQECIKGCGRWRQGRHGMCAKCKREENERRWREDQELLAAAQHDVVTEAELHQPKGPGRTLVVNGREFEVVFDGT